MSGAVKHVRALALAIAAAGALVAAAGSPGAGPMSMPMAMPGPEASYVAGEDSLFPRLRYADSLVSRNDRCIVTARKLNTRMAPVYVNGEPIGFC